MKMNTIGKTSVVMLTMAALAACGGGGGGSAVPNTPTAPEPAGEMESLLVQAGTSEAYTSYVRAGLENIGGLRESGERLEEIVESPFPDVVRAAPMAEPTVTESAAGDSSMLASGGSAFSNASTNLLVAGVDEADAVKYNGTHLFLANQQKLTVMSASVNAPMAEIAALKLIADDDFSRVQNLFYFDDAGRTDIAAIRGGGAFLFSDALSILPFFGSNETVIDIVDVSAPDNPGVTSHITIDGNLIESRRIGSQLFLLTQFSPDLEGFERFPQDDETIANNEALLAQAEEADLLPAATQDGAGNVLLDPGACYLPPESAAAIPTLTSMNVYDFATQELTTRLCIADGVWGFHMNDSALYLASPASESAGSIFAETRIHKFARNGADFEYRGSGSVPGSFWGDPRFLMAESANGDFVVITTLQDEGESRFSHQLSILRESSAEGESVLELAGAIPNDTRPAAIGKPNEQIFAARIVGDRAFVVTFEQIDPVYAIDLSNSSDPEILAELEIEGFSTYLQPLSDSLLIGVGANTRMQDGFIVNDGVNVRLFDVGDPTSVTLVDEVSYGRDWSFTPASFDHHALTTAQLDDDTVRIALPVTRYGSHDLLPDAERFSNPWTDTALQLLQVNLNEQTLSQAGQITAEDHATGERYHQGCCSWQSRSFLNADTVFYLNKNRLLRASFDTPEVLTGQAFIPTVSDGTNCGEFTQDPVYVSLFDRASGAYLSCNGGISEDPDSPPTDPDAPPAADETSVLADRCETQDITIEPAVTGAGSYAVTAALPGYESQTVNNVQIQANACGVVTTQLSLYLKAQ